MKGLFITGTDTNVGKTYVTVRLLQAFAQTGGPQARVGGFKAFCSGSREDAELIAAASRPEAPLDLVNPCWFSLPTAPLVAIRQLEAEAYPLQLESIWTAWEQLCADYDLLLAEGVGGWLAPLLPEMRVSDFAKALDLPVLVVVGNRLGALNHTLLTVERILSDGLVCAGVLLNNPQTTESPRQTEMQTPSRNTNAQMLAELLPAGVPFLGELAAGAEILPDPVVDVLCTILDWERK